MRVREWFKKHWRGVAYGLCGLSLVLVNIYPFKADYSQYVAVLLVVLGVLETLCFTLLPWLVDKIEVIYDARQSNDDNRDDVDQRLDGDGNGGGFHN